MKPILYSISAFDYTKEINIQFVYQGQQIVSNTLKIFENTTGTEVYNSTQDSYKTIHVLPASSLSPGTYYAVVSVVTLDGTISPESDAVVFVCITAPVFGFVNVSPGDVVQYSIVDATLEYSQMEGQQIESYIVELYNTERIIIRTTGTIYQNPNERTFEFTSLEDDTFYYLRAHGITVDGYILDTGYIPFSVDYVKPSAFQLVELINSSSEAAVIASSNFIIVEGHSDSPVAYVGGQKADVRDNRIIFDSGFFMGNSYKVVWKFEQPELHTSVLEIVNPITENGMYVKFFNNEVWGEVGNQFYATLTTNIGEHTFSTHSNYIDNYELSDVIVLTLINTPNEISVTIAREVSP